MVNDFGVETSTVYYALAIRPYENALKPITNFGQVDKY